MAFKGRPAVKKPDAVLVNSGCIRLFHCVLVVNRPQTVCVNRAAGGVPVAPASMPPHIVPPWVFGPPRRGADPLLCLRRAARARGSACQRRNGAVPRYPLIARAILAAAFPAQAVFHNPTVNPRATVIPIKPPPLSECRFLVPSVRVRLSYMPFNPAAMHSHQPRYPELAPVRGHCGSVCCRRRTLRRHLHRPAFAASDALAHPQGHAQKNAAGVRPSSGLAGFGSGLLVIPARTTATLPARRKRHSEIGPRRTAFKSVLLCVAIPEAGLSPPSSPEDQHPLDPPTADRRQEPPARLF
jgi:hypothetical protein